MEIYDKQKHGYIEVWLTNAEQQTVNREQLSHSLLSEIGKKCKIIYFLSGQDDLLTCTGNLLTHNL